MQSIVRYMPCSIFLFRPRLLDRSNPRRFNLEKPLFLNLHNVQKNQLNIAFYSTTIYKFKKNYTPQKNRFLKKLLKFQPIKSHKCFRGHDTPLLSLLLLCTNTPMISRNRWTRCSYGTRTHNGTKFHFYTFYSSNHQDLTWVRRNYRRNVTTPRTYVH